MRRREVVAGLAGAAALWSASGRSQTPRPRILWLSTEVQPDPFVEGFREGLRNHGYVDGQNVEIELHSSTSTSSLSTSVSTSALQGRGDWALATQDEGGRWSNS